MNKQTQDLLRMSDMYIFILMYEYFPNGRRNISEARKKWKTNTLEEVGSFLINLTFYRIVEPK